MKKITNLLLATMLILSSCSKEDDLLTPIPNNPTDITNTDTTTITNGDNGTTTLEHTPNENLVVNDGGVIQTDLEGTKWRVNYTSFYLNNRFPMCTMPYDTIVGPNVWHNMGEVYFSNQGDGYLETRTYLIDCAPMYNLDGTTHYEPLFNYTPNPNNPNPLLKQDYVSYSINNDEIIINVVQGVVQWKYTITLKIVEQTNTTLILENNSSLHDENTNAQGYISYYDRNIRLELEKIN